MLYVWLRSVGNPLAQEILNLYQEPDGTRRLLNYLLDNLAGTKRGESTPLVQRSRKTFCSCTCSFSADSFHAMKWIMPLFSYWTFFWFALNYCGVNITMFLHHLRFTRWLFFLCFCAIVSIDQPPSRSWIQLQDTDRTRPAGETQIQFITDSVSFVLPLHLYPGAAI